MKNTATTMRTEPCEHCAAETTRRTVLVLNNRVFPNTPVCESCDTCEVCGKTVERSIVENTHGTFVVHTCACEEAGQDGNTFITRH
jgi:hypothetical protein